MKRIIISFLLIFLCSFSEAFNNEITHRDLTIEAVKSSNLRGYLSKNLGPDFAKEYETVLRGKKIIDWLKDGSIAEDIPACRAANHFHDPIKNRGLSDVLYSAADPCGVLMPGLIIFPCTPSAINTGIGFLAYCTAEGAVTGRSYIPWNSTVTWASTAEKNEWNWKKTRGYYYNALTSNNPTMREENFAKTFKGLGKHLSQDTSHIAYKRRVA